MLRGFEPFGLRAYGVSSRKQAGRHVLAGLIGDQTPRDASLHVGDRDRGAGDHGAALVGDGTENSSCRSLPEHGNTQQKQTRGYYRRFFKNVRQESHKFSFYLLRTAA